MATDETDDGRRIASCGNVFLDLGFSPEEATILAMRSDLVCQLARWLQESGLTVPQAAERLGVSPVRVTDLVRGRWDQFSLDRLVQLAVRTGQRVELKIAA
ncbi:MAG: helix-turn-helix domain-containing protein [Candidatus Contendobacter sp.]|nr:helix-turn-helix domain-containing protein [Candidatus Contendobacter sp.]